ncbi:MAG: hypothetical protein ABIP54_00985, partial [Candidatus Andersenbacteria bacterium]
MNNSNEKIDIVKISEDIASKQADIAKLVNDISSKQIDIAKLVNDLSSKETDIVSLVNSLSLKRKNRVAVGVLHDYPISIESLEKVKDEVEIVIVGPKRIGNFEFIESTDARDLIRLAKDRKVDAVFRGNFDAVDVYEAIH